jgi:tetratricopeptide (TPR) repeat protein
VTDEARAATSGTREIDHLLPLALSRPREALARAREVLAGRPGPREASVAHQVASIVLRELGDTEAAVTESRLALRLARRTGSVERETDVLSSLGLALVFAGRTTAGLASFETAVQRSAGVLSARVLARRGAVLYTLGRYPAALEDLRYAVTVLRRAGDTLWTARALNNRGLVNLALGSTSRADADFVSAAYLFSEGGQEPEARYIVGNRALVAFASGDLPAALALYDEAIPSYQTLKMPTTQLRIDRCAVLLAAGLVRDALTEAEDSVNQTEQIRGWSTQRAYLLLMAANCALAADRPEVASACSGPSGVPGGRRTRRTCSSRPDTGRARRRPRCSARRTGPPTGSIASTPATRRRRSCWPGGSRWTSGAGTRPNAIWSPRPGSGGAARRCPGSAAGWPRRCGPRPPTSRTGCWPPAARA